ncbi:hypothetical protein EX895_001663 [Sporisorium graminicola]|uniref:Cyclin N-terminal domain-containing protein n=1 Tax=Sporisorium graminicola TaxID=280036 RepID=A0A4U7L1L5_9BASI|nr:hypothetical protein EX895_001663 [Sporisorium graminicola]TKY89132.1 hypothetical protein EX895_001663 [Sporisorium graminicola]
MSFYHDGQPATAAFGHPDGGYAMNPYTHHEQAHPLAAVPPAGYPFVDPSAQAQMYHHQSYTDMAHPSMSGAVEQHHAWQAPQAPRLTAAAARAARHHMMGYAPAGYPQTHGAIPWYTQTLGVPQPYQQPRTHQQLEHQLLVQHHLAKAHERQSGASMYQSAYGQNPGSVAYPQQQQQQQHHHHHSRPHQYPQQQHYTQPSHPYPPAIPAEHDGRVDRQRRYHDGWASSSSHRAEGLSNASHDWSGWNHAPAAHRGSVGYLPQHEQMYANHAVQTSQRLSDDASFHNAAAWASHQNSTASRMHGWNHAPRYSQHTDDRHNQSGYPDLAATSRLRHDYSDHRPHAARSQDRLHDFAAHHREVPVHSYSHLRTDHQEVWHHRADEARDHPEPTHWQSQSQAEARHDVPDDLTAPVAEEQERAPAEAAADQAAVPAPCSPGSLEKSALPIAAIGAQLIWNACTALFDPDLLIEAHETADEAMDEDCDEAMSPAVASMPSSSSTPSLNTPDISPWQSTVLDRPVPPTSPSSGDWNAFRSPFGPDRMPQLRPQAHSFTFGSEHASSQHDLHRMAVGAERARRDASPAKRTRQGSGHSEAATGHSSGASTASSSEPGTPASLAHESPALSSTVSAHSVETARSPLRAAGLGMSLDGSRSEPAIRARRNSSKTSPKLATSKWSGRMRDNVLAVLRLVSPDWRWSNNDHILVSLSETLPTATAKSSPSHSQGRSGGRDSFTSIVTSYANEPSPAFRRFVHQVLAQTLLSPPAFLLGILNALRLLVLVQLPDGSIDPVVLELFAQPTSAAPFKLFTLGMMIANKHLDDNTFLNKTWNEVTGIPLAELNQTEAWFLKKCNYEVNVPDETWIGFLNRLQSWEEKRSSRGMHRDSDSSKRLLLVLDEALSHFDAIPALQLDDDEVTHDVEHAKAASPMDMWSRSHHRVGSLAMDDAAADQQHCRSAPAAGQKLVRHEDNVQRPGHILRASLAIENPSATLLRSSSDFVVAGGPGKDFSPLSESSKSHSGPLMPSALLNGSRALFQHGGMFGPLATSS